MLGPFSLFVGLTSGLAPSAVAAPTARFTARPLQEGPCVTPCAVHFDAIGDGFLSPSPYASGETTDAAVDRPFHDLLFRWDFGDPGAGTWAHSGVSKNEDEGAVAGHVYTEPGTYSVSLSVKNPAGEWDTASTTIEVVDPTAVYADDATFCFANDDLDWSGCPLDCTTSDNCTVGSDFDQLMEYGENCIGNDDCADADTRSVRVLLRRGDTFVNSIGTAMNASDEPTLLEGFGTGARPYVDGSLELGSGWVFTGIDTNALTFLDVDHVTVYDVGIEATDGWCIWYASFPDDSQLNQLLGIVETTCRSNTVAIWGSGMYTLFMGNQVERDGLATTIPYTMRTSSYQHTVLAHNAFDHPDPAGNHWQFRSNDEWAYGTDETLANVYNIVHDNVQNLSSQMNAWAVRLCNDSGCNCVAGTCDGYDGDGRIVDVGDWIFERNVYRYVGGSPTSKLAFYEIQGGDVTIRNEIHKYDEGFPNEDKSLVLALGETFHVSGWSRNGNVHVYDNTVYVTGPYDQSYMWAESSTMFGASGCGTGCEERNNLFVVTSGSGADLAPSPGFSGGEDMILYTDPFDGTMPGQGAGVASDFVPERGSAPIDAGATANVLDDARGLCRVDGALDMGAVEANAEPCVSDGTEPIDTGEVSDSGDTGEPGDDGAGDDGSDTATSGEDTSVGTDTGERGEDEAEDETETHPPVGIGCSTGTGGAGWLSLLALLALGRRYSNRG